MSAGSETDCDFIERAYRRRTYKSALVYNDGCGGARPCILKNISETGALLHIEDINGLPSSFKVAVELDDFEVDAKWIWRKDVRLGVQFQGPLQIYHSNRKQVVLPVDGPMQTDGIDKNKTKMQWTELRYRLAQEAAEREKCDKTTRLGRRGGAGFGKR